MKKSAKLGLSLATIEQAQLCFDLLSSGREYQRQCGFVQWEDGYPQIETVQNDILNQKGYIFTVDGAVAGYISIGYSDEPAYQEIDGAFRAQDEYAVFHRITLGKEFRAKGLAREIIALAENHAKASVSYVRIDTHKDNEIMRKILQRCGYVYCGKVYLRGSERKAYDKFI